MTNSRVLVGLFALGATCSCSRNDPVPDPGQSGGAESAGGSAAGGMLATGGRGADGGQAGADGGSSAIILEPPTGVEYHPPPGFEDCQHAEVKEDCEEGWCRLPPSCVVIGSTEDTWLHGRYTEVQTEVTLTHSVEVQRYEMSRREWNSVTGVLPSEYKEQPDGECLEDDCPINNVTWWEAVRAADMLSEQRGLEPCYASMNCTGELGKGLACEGVADPERSVYECEGYRLPTWSEAEYAARAGTISDFYTGNVTVYSNLDCNFDENLDKAAWYCFNSQNTAHARGRKLPNGFGLFDVLGNVIELTNEPNRTTQAKGGRDPNGHIGSDRDRLSYGGVYDSPAFAARAANLLPRYWDTRSPRAGLRLYRTLFEDSERSNAIVED